MHTVHTAIAPTRYAVSHVDKRTWIDTRPGERVAVHVGGDHLDGKYTILEAVIAPDCRVPLHYHSGEAELFHMLEGCLRFQIGEDRFEAAAGTTIVVPCGVVHAWHNRTAQPARMLAIFSPGGIENMFDEIADAGLADFDKIARRYGTIIVGPSLEDA